jgi:hypothetical protein
MNSLKTANELLAENYELRKQLDALKRAAINLADEAQISVNVENENRKDVGAWLRARDYDMTKGRAQAAIAVRLLAGF